VAADRHGLVFHECRLLLLSLKDIVQELLLELSLYTKPFEDDTHTLTHTHYIYTHTRTLIYTYIYIYIYIHMYIYVYT